MRIVLTEPPPDITPPLKIKVEQGTGVEPSHLPDLAKEIEGRMLQLYRVRSKVEFVPPEALGRVTKKTPMFEEKYH
jgi:phenylacetate-CoA ligase